MAGVDEAGRGPLAGPVVAAAVILDPNRTLMNLDDSKKLSAARREKLFDVICSHAIAVGIGLATSTEIDAINILEATMLAMQRAVCDLKVAPTEVLCDGNRCPAVSYPVTAIVRGDATVACISAASIIAKVTRDRMMEELHQRHPQYGFNRHKGYPTAAHRRALAAYGPIGEHRQSFAPVRNCAIEWPSA
jgi:ribonuclease HII